MIRLGALLPFAVLICACSSGAPSESAEPAVHDPARDDLMPLVRESGYDGVFVAREAGADTLVCVGGELCDERFPPASTFKVPNALLALDYGVLDGPGHTLPWDGEERWLESWNRDHTLASAMRHSVVWYFQSVARDVGAERMQDALDRFDYGNREIGGAVDEFWLDASLQISPMEQVGFWHRLHDDELGVDGAATAVVLEVTELARDEVAVLRAKTGWFRREGETNRGWFAGCVEGERRVCFATVLFADDPFVFEDFIRARKDTSIRLLTALGYHVPSE
jgi:beta-lactamase class D